MTPGFPGDCVPRVLPGNRREPRAYALVGITQTRDVVEDRRGVRPQADPMALRVSRRPGQVAPQHMRRCGGLFPIRPVAMLELRRPRTQRQPQGLFQGMGIFAGNAQANGIRQA